MNAKELQQQYLESTQTSKEKPNTSKISTALPPNYISHVRKQYERISKHLNHEEGLYYIKDALKDFPEVLEQELKRVRVR